MTYNGPEPTFNLVVWGTENAVDTTISQLVVRHFPDTLVVDFFITQPDWEYAGFTTEATTIITGVTIESNCTPIPSLTQWGIIGLVLLMLAAGAMVIVRRRRALARA